MKHFRKIWDEAKNSWILEHKMNSRKKAYEDFLAAFPDVRDVSFFAFNNQRSRLGATATQKKPNRSSRVPLPLYSEHQKKGYIRIKIAQPNVWISKAQWVYMETHPWEDCSERSSYIFLDGDNRNFAPRNIERVPLRLMGIFNGLGGCEKGHPEITRANLLLARLKTRILDKGEALGEVVRYNHFRKFRRDMAEKARKYRSRPGSKEKIREQRKRAWQKLKENPEKYQEMLRKHREYLKEYRRRRCESKNLQEKRLHENR